MSKAEAKPIKQRAPTLYVIIAIKFLKGAGLLLLAAGVYRMQDNDLPAAFNNALLFFHVDPEQKFFFDLARKISVVTPAMMINLALSTVFYAMFSLVEGIGLMFRMPWAGWLAIGESAFFIPIEVHELLRYPVAGRAFYAVLTILALNTFMVWYLFQNRERLFRRHPR